MKILIGIVIGLRVAGALFLCFLWRFVCAFWSDKCRNPFHVFGHWLATAEKPRSPQWPKVRRAKLREQNSCEACGGKKCLQVHHVKEFHRFPELELVMANLIVLCECCMSPKAMLYRLIAPVIRPVKMMLAAIMPSMVNHHLKLGHTVNGVSNWKINNPNVRADAAAMLATMPVKMMMSAEKKAFFVNPNGYSIAEDVQASSWWKTVYDFTLDPQNPLTFIAADSAQYRPAATFHTDQGSIPRPAQLFIPKDRFLGFYAHDAGYINKGLTIDGKFTAMTRKQVDDLLYDMILADPIPGNAVTAHAVWAAVRMFGGLSWGKSQSSHRFPPMADILKPA